MPAEPFATHSLEFDAPRSATVDGIVYLHQRCRICGRDFAMVDGVWRAVHVTGLSFQLLEDEVSLRWMKGRCPGILLIADEQDGRKARAPA
jgi:hypothetical protein